MRGGRRERAGRKKGIPNKLTQDIRSAIGLILKREIPALARNLKKLAVNSPGQHASIVTGLIEFSIPRLQRVEQKDISSFQELALLTPEARREKMREIAREIINQKNGKEEKS
ncbi:hypothetical protein [Chryseolinea sp. H1M3-3]|uniref:hypothetical protein n=1 Tax=Chryseolinea sp. H1M3-3 TaxID=3034144 RepID=UPI0023EC51F7|nr:hypothetical protein [Chryseolinea sp. H1M3-3]